jgi:hypothetical protein
MCPAAEFGMILEPEAHGSDTEEAAAVVGGRDKDASATGSGEVQSPAWPLRFQ